MDTLQAFALGAANRGKERMVFDWNKAAEIIIQNDFTDAIAGLESDMEWTGGKIFESLNPVNQEDTYVYLASTWDTPIIEINGVAHDCYLMENDTEWDETTYWPESALEIINKAKKMLKKRRK